MNITILGCGAYGLALATSFLENNINLCMWSKFEKEINYLKEGNQNINFTTNLELAIQNSDLVVIAIPVNYIEETLISMKEFYHNQDILIASKGIDTMNLKFAHELIEKHLSSSAPIGVISGGSFAIDMTNKKIMGLTLGTNIERIKEKVKNSLENSYLKIQYTSDYIGVSTCGAIKNVMAIAHGILDGANYPESSRFLFLTEAIYEIKKLIKKLGGNPDIIMSYAGIDDIMMTCTSSKSRNYTLGRMIGKKSTNEEIEEYKKNTTIEGLGTTKAIYELCQEKQIELPITTIIYNILYKNSDIETLITYLKEKKSWDL